MADGTLRDALAGVVEQLSTIARGMEAAAAEMASARLQIQQQREDFRRQKQQGRLLIALVVIALGLAVTSLHVNQQNSRILRSQNNLSQLVLECTTPDNPSSPILSDRVHECYDNSQTQQARAIQEVIDGVRAIPTTTLPRG